MQNSMRKFILLYTLTKKFFDSIDNKWDFLNDKEFKLLNTLLIVGLRFGVVYNNCLIILLRSTE